MDRNNSVKFLGLQRWQNSKISEMGFGNAFAYNPIVAKNKAGGFQYEFLELIQDSQTQDPNIVYAVPPHYVKTFSSKIWEFDIKFPAFSLPNNKIVAIDAQSDKRNNESMLSRGVTYAAGSTSEVVFIDDTFLTSIGCPPRGQDGIIQEGDYNATPIVPRITQFDQWIEGVNFNTLLLSFIDAVSAHTSKGLIMINWECVEQSNSFSNKENQKLLDIFAWYQNQNFNAKISCWNVSPRGLSRIAYENGTNTVGNRYPTLSQYLDISYVGGYIIYPTNFGVIHHYLKEYLACKALYPNQTSLATIWDTFETVGSDWQIRPSSPKGRLVNQSGNDAGDYIWFNKPAVFNQVMYNWGVWCIAFGDGFHLWDDWLSTDDPAFPPFGATKNGVPIAQGAGKMYARNDKKNIDWLMRGVYGVSQYASVINDTSTSWVISDIDNSLYTNKPLIAYKKSGSQVLILAYSWYNNEDNIETTSITIDGISHTINMYGTWTTIKKVN